MNSLDWKGSTNLNPRHRKAHNFLKVIRYPNPLNFRRSGLYIQYMHVYFRGQGILSSHLPWNYFAPPLRNWLSQPLIMVAPPRFVSPPPSKNLALDICPLWSQILKQTLVLWIVSKRYRQEYIGRKSVQLP